jgi:hypothetical protein
MARQSKPAGKRRPSTVVPTLVPGTLADDLRRALVWFSSENSFADLRRHGNVGWKTVDLIVLAVLWVWSDHANLTGAFTRAVGFAETIFGAVAVTTYQGLTGALRSYRESLLPQLWSLLHLRMEQAAREHWRIGMWLALAVDGSRVTTPRTVSNEQAFAAANFGRGGKAKYRRKWKNKKRRSKKLCVPVKPQIWLTLIWHMGLKMPWCWKTGPSTACERHDLLELLETQLFPENTLFCADAGFVGYELWKTLQERDCHFLIRVGANVRLLRGLAHVRQCDDLVYLWPAAMLRQQEPPLVLRLLEFQGPKGKVCLVTNVLSERKLSGRQAGQLYRLRWGVELQFRAFKQTFGRRKLRSRSAANALVELDWSLVGLWLVQLFAVKEQIKIHSPPAHSSVSLALDVIHDAMRNLTDAVPPPERLRQRLRRAVKDKYRRKKSKTARYRPDYKDKPSAKEPIILRATPAQRQAYQELRHAA